MKKAIIDLRPWIVPILLLIIWEVVARLNLVSASLFPSPISIIVKGWELTISGELATHVWASLGRALAGMLIGGTIGFVLGIRSEEHTSELQSRENLVCSLLLEKKNA